MIIILLPFLIKLSKDLTNFSIQNLQNLKSIFWKRSDNEAMSRPNTKVSSPRREIELATIKILSQHQGHGPVIRW